jgi:hypothetical protein
MEKHELEVWIAVDADGSYEVAEDQDTVLERFSENYGGNCRVVKLNVRVAGPAITEARMTVPDEAGELVEADAE